MQPPQLPRIVLRERVAGDSIANFQAYAHVVYAGEPMPDDLVRDAHVLVDLDEQANARAVTLLRDDAQLMGYSTVPASDGSGAAVLYVDGNFGLVDASAAAAGSEQAVHGVALHAQPPETQPPDATAEAHLGVAAHAGDIAVAVGDPGAVQSPAAGLRAAMNDVVAATRRLDELLHADVCERLFGSGSLAGSDDAGSMTSSKDSLYSVGPSSPARSMTPAGRSSMARTGSAMADGSPRITPATPSSATRQMVRRAFMTSPYRSPAAAARVSRTVATTLDTSALVGAPASSRAGDLSVQIPVRPRGQAGGNAHSSLLFPNTLPPPSPKSSSAAAVGSPDRMRLPTGRTPKLVAARPTTVTAVQPSSAFRNLAAEFSSIDEDEDDEDDDEEDGL